MSGTDKTSLGDRMKLYESATEGFLTPRTPIILRVDGKAFHTYTKGLKRPWDLVLNSVMDMTAIELCNHVQGAQIAYVQSDEISILVHGYKTHTSQAYFDGRIQKIVSVVASIAAATFTSESWRIWDEGDSVPNKASRIRPAYFDCRAFVMPESEVCNYFLWRQQDATRNSVQSLARALYSHKECNNKNGSQLQDMCMAKGHNWNALPTQYKRGRCIVRQTYEVESSGGASQRTRWAVDEEIPVFSQDREYINKLLAVEED